VRVDWMAPGGSAEGWLRIGDVLLGIDGQPIANDGTVASGELRLPFGLLVDRRQIGEKLPVRILRDGIRKDLSVPLKGFPSISRRSNLYDRRPRYYVYGGLVFVPLDREMLKTYGDEWQSDADPEILYEFFYRAQAEPEFLRKERIVLLRRLDHPANANISFFKNMLIDRVNGRAIESLEDLIRAIEENRGKYHVFEFAYFGRMAVLDREAADRANPQILRDYGIAGDRNP
jgi:hypothetical protein